MTIEKPLKTLKLDELIILAKQCVYREPDGHFGKWDENDLFFTAISRYINDDFLLNLTLIVCKKIPPVKLFVKNYLRNYIKTCNS